MTSHSLVGEAHSFPFFLPLNQEGEALFYREREVSLPCQFPMWDCPPQRKKPYKPPNFEGLQICLSSIEFTSVTNTSNEVK